MRNYHFFIVIISLVLIAGCSKDDNPVITMTKGTISGKVTEQTSGNAISGVTIRTQPATKTVITDEIGNYSITEIEAGNYTLTVTKDGYITTTANVKVISDQTTNINFSLSVPPPDPAKPEIYINLFQNKEIIDTAQIQIIVVDTSLVEEVVFFVDGISTLSFNQKNNQFIWAVPEFENGSSHQIYCTAKNIYDKTDTSEIFNVTTFTLDTINISNIIASEDSIFVQWNYPDIYFDLFHTLLTIKNNNNLVLSETHSINNFNVTYKDSLNDFYDYTLEVTAVFKGREATKHVTKKIELSPTPKLGSIIAPSRVHPASVSHVYVEINVISRDQLKNLDSVNLYLFRPDSSFAIFSMNTPDLNTVSGIYSFLMSTAPVNVPVLGKYRFEVEAIHKNGRKSKRVIKTIIFG